MFPISLFMALTVVSALTDLSMPSPDTEQMTEGRGPTLSIDVQKIRYCEEDSDVIQLNVKWTFLNRTPEDYVIYAGSPSIEKVMLAEDVARLRAGVYVMALEGFLAVSSDAPSLRKRDFTRLRPGEHITVDDSRVVPIITARSQESSVATTGLPHPGTYVLQVLADPWPTGADAREWSKRLAQSGTLWTETLLSHPIAFTIEKNPKLEKCR